MIQRIQTLYLFVAAVAMVVCAFYMFKMVVAGIVALVAAGLSLYDISLYKKRPLQARICWLLCLAGIGIIIYLVASITGHYSGKDFIYPLVAAIVATFCWLFAAKAIMKDEKLVRSLDRIR